MVIGWIQSADLEVKELGTLTYTQALQAFVNHDWVAEQALEIELRAGNNSFCPAGLGLNNEEDTVILHICPQNSNRNMVFFIRIVMGKKLLGLIPQTKRLTDTRYDLTDEECRYLMRLFFEEAYEQLRDQLNQRGHATPQGEG
ncbi:MAG: hypothetical protein JXB35_15345 [Anaerolineae bacterium]|nr:hypothetical protein [Anaerolineae bacterium]